MDQIKKLIMEFYYYTIQILLYTKIEEKFTDETNTTEISFS